MSGRKMARAQLAAAKKKKAAKKSSQAPVAVEAATSEEFEDDGQDFGEEDFEGEDDWEEDEADDVDYERAIDTQDLPWAIEALECAKASLEECLPEIGDTTMYSFKVNPRTHRVYIRLDKAADKYGSPLMEDLTLFSRNYNNRLEEKEVHPDIEVEVSSPGAERVVLVPSEFERFEDIPMRVVYQTEDMEHPQVQFLDFHGFDETNVVFRLADVRANRPEKKGQKISKKKLTTDIPLPIAAIKQVNLHIDM